MRLGDSVPDISQISVDETQMTQCQMSVRSAWDETQVTQCQMSVRSAWDETQVTQYQMSVGSACECPLVTLSSGMSGDAGDIGPPVAAVVVASVVCGWRARGWKFSRCCP